MKKNSKASPAKDVDEYLASVPEPARVTLGKLRRTIKAAAPEAKETISWRMPMYYDHGMLVGFAAFKDHLSFFPGSENEYLLELIEDEINWFIMIEIKVSYRFPEISCEFDSGHRARRSAPPANGRLATL